jgi:hypothetical protein
MQSLDAAQQATLNTTAVVPAACHNCGASLQGRFCSNCGQEDRPLDPTVGEVVGEVAREVSALDGRILRTLRRLFMSPGFLTLEHFEGRRVGWVSPIRLYLIISFFYFAISSFTGASPLNVDMRATGDSDEETNQAIQKLGFSTEEDMQRAVNAALATWIPRAMFVLIPLFGWLVALVRRGSQRNYPHHVIFALHLFAAFFGVQAVAVGGGYLSRSETVAFIAGALSLIYALSYMVIAMKAVYGGTTARAVAHAFVVLGLYWLATIAVAVAIVVPVLWWK